MTQINELIEIEESYQNLQERYEEAIDYIDSLTQNQERSREELRYLNDFIRYHRLDEAFRYFKEHAHEDEETELPFPYLVL